MLHVKADQNPGAQIEGTLLNNTNLSKLFKLLSSDKYGMYLILCYNLIQICMLKLKFCIYIAFILNKSAQSIEINESITIMKCMRQLIYNYMVQKCYKLLVWPISSIQRDLLIQRLCSSELEEIKVYVAGLVNEHVSP